MELRRPVFALLGLLLVGVFPAPAEIYKHVDANGKVTFSDQPSDDATVVEIAAPQKISGDAQGTNQINSKIEAASDRLATERRRSESQQQWQQRKAKNARQRSANTCQYYRDKLANLEYRWKLQNKNGYRQWQKDKYLVSRDRYQRDIKRHC